MTGEYICIHCNSKFVKEKTLTVHMCEPKRRFFAKNERHVQMGFLAYNRFFQLNQKNDINKTYENFIQSPYYTAFVKFGSFLSNVNPLYPEKFIDYIVTSGVKLDYWCNESLYEKYILKLIKTESVETALQRSIATMMDWADNYDSLWNHYFLYVSTNRASFNIKDGKISPWLLLNSENGKKMLASFSDEQLDGISAIIDPNFWINTFRTNKEDLDLVRQVIKESNI